MDKHTFYIKAFGLVVLSGVAKTVIQVVGQAVSAPTTVINNKYEQKPPATTTSDIRFTEDSERG